MRIVEADSAVAALQFFATQRPDLIISDIGLPTIDGYQLMRQIRAMEAVTADPSSKRATPIPAIALTAYARDSDRDRAINVGYQHHLGKPVEPTQLLGIVHELLKTPATLSR